MSQLLTHTKKSIPSPFRGHWKNRLSVLSSLRGLSDRFGVYREPDEHKRLGDCSFCSRTYRELVKNLNVLYLVETFTASCPIW